MIATDATRSDLLPYNGSHHCLPDGCPKVMNTFTSDVSGRVTYAFNSLGFRGEEFQPAADRHIFACGCSLTFGLGLDYADAWISVFRTRYLELHGLDPSSVNLQNFSSTGNSNGYIARTLIAQCARVRPTLALAQLTLSNRAELLEGNRSYNIGDWCLHDSFDQGAAADGHDRELRQLIRRKAKAFYDFHTEAAGMQDLLKNALLLQWFFQLHDIPYFIGIFRPGTNELRTDELLQPWRELLDPTRVFTARVRDCLVDYSAAPGHPGPAGSLVIAEQFLSRYRDSVALPHPDEVSNVYPLF